MYFSPQRIKTLIIICSRTAQRWICKQGYEYKNVLQDIFIDEHKRSSIVKDHKNFVKKMEKLKRYMIEFEEDGTIKPKVYLSACELNENNWQSIIVITHNEYTFSANNRV